MFGKLISLAVLAAVAYFAVTEVLPWVQNEFGGGQGRPELVEDESAYCVDSAAAANDDMTRTVRSYSTPPVDLDSWSVAVSEIESSIRRAQAACSCPTTSCSKASQAITEIQGQLWSLDNLIRASSTGFSNPARQQERIQSLLNEARAALP